METSVKRASTWSQILRASWEVDHFQLCFIERNVKETHSIFTQETAKHIGEHLPIYKRISTDTERNASPVWSLDILWSAMDQAASIMINPIPRNLQYPLTWVP
jgi:hypothetical protein